MDAGGSLRSLLLLWIINHFNSEFVRILFMRSYDSYRNKLEGLGTHSSRSTSEKRQALSQIRPNSKCNIRYLFYLANLYRPMSCVGKILYLARTEWIYPLDRPLWTPTRVWGSKSRPHEIIIIEGIRSVISVPGFPP